MQYSGGEALPGRWVYRPFTRDEQEDLAERFRDVRDLVRNQIRAERERRGWSQTQLASELAQVGLRLDASAITRVESGERGVRVEEAWAFAVALRLDLSQLVVHPTIFATLEERIRHEEELLEDLRQEQVALTHNMARRTETLQQLRGQLGSQDARPSGDELDALGWPSIGAPLRHLDLEPLERERAPRPTEAAREPRADDVQPEAGRRG